MSLIGEGADLAPPTPPAASLRRLEPSIAGVGDYVALMKPRVMSLVIFTAFVGMLIAPGTSSPRDRLHRAPVHLGRGRSGRRAQHVVRRRHRRGDDAHRGAADPAGRIAPGEALGFGLTLAGFSIVVLGLLVNWLAAALLAFTIFFYVVVYTMWLKRSHPAEHRDRRGGGRLPADDRLGGGDRRHCRRAVPSVSPSSSSGRRRISGRCRSPA